MSNLGGVILIAVVVGGWIMWRRRAARRQAAAQERIAGVIAPMGPRGSYPRPARGRNSAPGRVDLRASVVCVLCGEGSGSDADGVMLLSWCGACRVERALGVQDGA